MALMGSCILQETTCKAIFIPKNLKLPQPNPAPKPQAKASSKASSSDEHVRLFSMVSKLNICRLLMLHCL